ncbi:MAG: hypothetical protein AB7G23_20095 [Vicinamibacterales bacterium]
MAQVFRAYSATSGLGVVPGLAEFEAAFKQVARLQIPAGIPELDRSTGLPASFSVSVSSAARSLGISDRAVRADAQAGRLHGRKDHHGWWRFEPDEIERYRKVRARR